MEAPTTNTVILDAGRVAPRTSLTHSLMRLNAGLWLAFLAISLATGIPAAWRYEKSAALTLLDGKLAQDFEHFITREHPYRTPSLNAWSAVEFKLFNSGKPGLVIGADGWLFSSEEFPLPSLFARNMERNLARVQSVVDSLAAHGIRTVILPIPTKAGMYREEVPAALRDHVLPMEAVTAALDARHLAWIPVQDAMQAARDHGQKVFFRTETHWTPEGARVAATTAQAWLHQRGLQQWHPQHFQLSRLPARPLESDLENYLPLSPLFSQLLPEQEQYIRYQVSPPKTVADADSLFSDTSHPLALVGTSYSADERWNFPGWLRLALGTDIDNVSEKGKGPFAPMERFLHLVDQGRTGARIVIWEFPVRTLAMDFGAAQAPKD